MSAIIFLIGVYVRNSNEERVLWISEEISSHLKQIAVHRFSVERGVYVNVSKRVVDASDLEYIPHVPCHQREVHLSGESKKRNGDSSQNAALFVIRAHLRARCRDCKNTEHLPSLSLSLLPVRSSRRLYPVPSPWPLSGPWAYLLERSPLSLTWGRTRGCCRSRREWWWTPVQKTPRKNMNKDSDSTCRLKYKYTIQISP